MSKNCCIRVFGVKKFIVDVKIVKMSLLCGENLTLKFDKSPTFGKNFGVKMRRCDKIFSSVSTLHIFFRIITVFLITSISI